MTQPLDTVLAALDRIAPLRLAESWDKVGLLVAGDGRAITRVLFAIDVLPHVLQEARALDAQLIVGYHPLLFKPLERLDGATWQGAVALDAVRAGIAIYSPHTALDSVSGGINDWLVECMLGAPSGQSRFDIRAIAPAAAASAHTHKLVVFVAQEACERVRAALAHAGAGRIGHYTQCSFSSEGEGTFEGNDASNPAVGTSGQLERVREVKLEMLLHKRALAEVVTALRTAHPYEEPAFDLIAIDAAPGDSRVGSGRIVRVEIPVTAQEIARKLELALGSGRIERTRPRIAQPAAQHHAIAVCAGSGASLIEAASVQGATLFVTGEMSHHDVVRAHSLGLEVLLAGHTNTERGYLPRLARALTEQCAEVECIVSTSDTEVLLRDSDD
jgi:dinuclear metal center YbgI/SA1388 family protein